MGGVIDLLADAHRLGLAVRLDGDRLVVRGPKRAEAIARALLAHKAEVLGVLRQTPSTVYKYRANPEENAKPVDVDIVDATKNAFTDIIVEDIEPGVDPWAEAEDWTDTTPYCSTCRSCAGWVDLLDGWHCRRCEPPRRSERWAAKAESIRRRHHNPVFTVTEEPEVDD